MDSILKLTHTDPVYADPCDEYNLFFEYSKQDGDIKTKLTFSISYVDLETLQKIIQGNFDMIELDDNDGSTNGLYWSLIIDQNKCVFDSESASGGSALILEFPRHHLVDALRGMEVLQDSPFQTNVKRGK